MVRVVPSPVVFLILCIHLYDRTFLGTVSDTASIFCLETGYATHLIDALHGTVFECTVFYHVRTIGTADEPTGISIVFAVVNSRNVRILQSQIPDSHTNGIR